MVSRRLRKARTCPVHKKLAMATEFVEALKNEPSPVECNDEAHENE